MGNLLSKKKKKNKKTKEELVTFRDVRRPPKVSLPFPLPILPMLTYWKSVPFLPENFMSSEEWKNLQLEATKYGITKLQIYELFLRLCSPYDVSYGTVQLRKFFREFDPRFRKVLRRLVVKLAKGHPRILFEDIVKFIFEFCGMDFYNLIVKSVTAVREFDVMNIITVRALVRYINGDRDMDEFTRSVLAHLHADPPFHHVSAFVQLCVRYPVLVYPIILMQRSMQRRFFGLRFWREYMKRTGNQLFPPDFSKVDAEMITSRVILLECVSLSAIPFQFGTKKTATDPPREFFELEMRKWNKRKQRLLDKAQQGIIQNNNEDEENFDDLDDEYDNIEEKERNKFESTSKRNINLQEGEIDLHSIRNESIAASAALAHHTGDKIRLQGNDTQEALGFLSLASPSVVKSLANRRISFINTSNEALDNDITNDNNNDDTTISNIPNNNVEIHELLSEQNYQAGPFQYTYDGPLDIIEPNTNNTERPKSQPTKEYNDMGNIVISPITANNNSTTGRKSSLTTTTSPTVMANHGRDRRRASLVAALNNNNNTNNTLSPSAFNTMDNMSLSLSPSNMNNTNTNQTTITTLSPTDDENTSVNRRSSVRRSSVVKNDSTIPSSPTNDKNNQRKLETYLHEKLYVQANIDHENRRSSLAKTQQISGGFGLSIDQTAEDNAITLQLQQTTKTQDSLGTKTLTNTNNNTYDSRYNTEMDNNTNRRTSFMNSINAPTSPTTNGRRTSVTSIPILPGTIDTKSTTDTTTTTTNKPSARNRRHSLLLPNSAAANSAFQAKLEFEKLSAGISGTSVEKMMNQKKEAILNKGLVTSPPTTNPISPDQPNGRRRSSMILPGTVETPPSSANPITARRRQSIVSGGVISPTAGSTTNNVISPGPTVINDAVSPPTTGTSTANATLAAAAKARRASTLLTGGQTWLSNINSPSEGSTHNTNTTNAISNTAPIPNPNTNESTSTISNVNPLPKVTKSVRIMEEPIIAGENNSATMNSSTTIQTERKEDSLPSVIKTSTFDLSDKLQQLQDKADKPLTDSEKMRIVNNIANQSVDDLNEKSQILVLQNFEANAKTMFDQGYSAVDTQIRLAAFGFSGMMGNNNAQARKERIEHTTSKILPIPVPPKVSEYLLEHPHPAGTVCKLTSLQISKIALAHVNSGAGQLYGIVRVPCLLCNRVVLHVDDLIAEEAEEELLQQQLEEEAEEEAQRIREETENNSEDDEYDDGYSDDNENDTYNDHNRNYHTEQSNTNASKTQTNDEYHTEPEYQQEYENDENVPGEDRAEGRKIAVYPSHTLHHPKKQSSKKGAQNESSQVSTSASNGTHDNHSQQSQPQLSQDQNNIPTNASNNINSSPVSSDNEVADHEGGYFMEKDDDDSDIDGYQRKEDPEQFVVDKKHRINKGKKRSKGQSDVARERMQRFRAKETEIKRRVALVKRQQEKLLKEEERIKKERQAKFVDETTIPVVNNYIQETGGIDDDLEDSVVHVITDKALKDPFAITLVTGSATGAIAGTRKPDTTAPPSTLVATKPPSKIPKESKKKMEVDEDDDDYLSDASSSYYETASMAHDSVAEAELAAIHEAERVAIARERLAKEQIFAKATAKNTGLCGECDLYCRRVATHLFGYKIATRLLETATVKPSVDDELNRHTQRARAENHPLVQGKPMDDEEIVEMQRKMELMRQAAILQAQEKGDENSLNVDLLTAQAQLNSQELTWKRLERDIYEYPDDNFIELYDEDTKRFFYYNVTIGESQWHKPKKYVPYKDNENRKEEELIQQQAAKELSKLELLSTKAAKTKVNTTLGQRS